MLRRTVQLAALATACACVPAVLTFGACFFVVYATEPERKPRRRGDRNRWWFGV